jgi:uncharacterized DUF497 family protein
MDIEFDDSKDAINQAKHGVSLALGAAVLGNRVGKLIDDRRDYGEVRLNAFGLVRDRLFVCMYTRPGPTFRIISVRKASM